MKKSIGRKYELELLENLFQRGDARLVTIKGRRRIGKSELVQEFAKGKRFLKFTGTSPDEHTTAQSEKNEFCDQISRIFGKPVEYFDDWTLIFYSLDKQLTDEPAIILFDEISWMSSKDSLFVPKLKNWWDLYLSRRSNFMLIFCGSISTWIEKNIIMSTAFYGRISLRLTVAPLPLAQCAKLLRTNGFQGNDQEIYRILSLTGGVPFYLEQIDPALSSKNNIKKLCFQKNGPFVNEFNMIFHDLFNGDGPVHKKILDILSTGRKYFSEIKKLFGKIDDETLKIYLEDLYVCGFIMRYTQKSLVTKKPLEEKVYGLCDPYVHFYLKYIEPRKGDIDILDENSSYEIDIPGFDGIIGLAIETLLIQNNSLIFKALGLRRSLDFFIGPYHQKTTKDQKGCQIDFAIQDNSNNFYVCELKFSSNEIKKKYY